MILLGLSRITGVSDTYELKEDPSYPDLNYSQLRFPDDQSNIIWLIRTSHCSYYSIGVLAIRIRQIQLVLDQLAAGAIDRLCN